MALKLKEIFKKKYHNNILPLLDEDKVDDIKRMVNRAYESDKQSNGEKIRQLQEIVDLAMNIAEQKTYPWENASNVIIPLISQAAIEFGASCYTQIIQDGEVVKPKIIGNDDGKPETINGIEQVDKETGKVKMMNAGLKLAKGKRVCQMMNYQFMEQMPWWETDLDKAVHSLPVVGTLFKKVYYDPLKKMCVSELIFPDKLIINNNARDIEECVITEVKYFYPQEIQQRIRSGLFVDYDFGPGDYVVNSSVENADSLKADPTTIGDNLRQFIEQRNWFDLDEDGFLEPYIVTIDVLKGIAVRMIPCFEEDDIEYNEDKEIKNIKKNQQYIIWRFIPSPDGSFYGIGFGHLLYNLNVALNTSTNQLIDTATIANNGGGFIGKGLNIKGGRLSITKNEWKIVDNFGSSLKDNIVPFPVTEPSQTTFALLGFLLDMGKGLGSLRDLLAGETPGSMAPAMYMGMLEQGLKQYKSIYKRVDKGLKEEFKYAFGCNEKYLSNAEYAAILNEDKKDVSVKMDFDRKAYSIIPVADPASITSIQKMGQAQFVLGLMQDPFYDPIKLRRILNSSVQISGLEEALRIPQDKPDPSMILAQAEQMKAQAKQAEVELNMHKLSANIEKTKYEIEGMLAEIKLKESQVLKNLSDAEAKEKEHNLKGLIAAGELMTTRIQVEAGIKAKQDENAFRQQELDQAKLEAQQSAQAESVPAAQEAVSQSE